MIQGLYAAANGMIAVEERQAVIANNVANATTTGFKRQIAVQQGYYMSFAGELGSLAGIDLLPAPGGGVKTIETFSNFSNGLLQPTGNPFDVALMGPAFLRVETPAGDRFTRNGRFAVGGQGELVTLEGYAVLDASGGPISIGGGSLYISGDGTVTVDGEVRGQLALLEFDDPHALSREGYTLYAATEEAIANARQAESTTVHGGALEISNVKIPNEVTQMMMALRAYSANQKVISAIDETASRMIDQIGAPG